MRDAASRKARNFVLAAYVIPTLAFAIARATAGPAMGGPMPRDAGDYLALGGFAAGALCGLVAAVYAHRSAATGLKILGLVALVVCGSVLGLALFGPTWA